MSIVLVGNGPSATIHKLGDRIDSFEEVVRFNNFITAGYEEWVGTKTTLWARNTTNSVLPRPGLNIPILYCGHPRERSVLPADAELVSNRGEHLGLEYGRVFSTGFAAIHALVKKHPKLRLVGFDFFRAIEHHYFPSGDQCWHDGVIEELEVNRYVKEGRIVFLTIPLM